MSWVATSPVFTAAAAFSVVVWLFFRGTYNFIGESLTVPFVGAGYGSSLGDVTVGVYQVGGGIKRFLSERASFDVGVSYQGITAGGPGQMSLQYGMSIYLGN